MPEVGVKINVSCIYARKDGFFYKHLSSRLDQLYLENQIDAIHYMEVSDQPFAERQYSQEEREADIYLIVLSPHLLASPFIQSGFLKKKLLAHQFKQLKILPLLWTEGIYSNTALIRLERLKSNDVPIHDMHEISLDANLSVLMEELIVVIRDWRKRKQTLWDRWQETQEKGELIYYSNFLKDYPHSVFSPAAREEHNELKEKELWDTAVSIDTVHNYYLYLRDAPLKKNRVDAIKRISQIEQDEAIAKVDAMQSSSLPLLFDYKVRFPKGKAIAEIEKKIGKLVEDRVNHIAEPEYIQTEAYYLQHLAYEKLNKDEIMSMGLLLNFTTSLIKHSRRVMYQITNNQVILVLFGFLGVIVAGSSLSPLIEHAVNGSFGFRPFLTFIYCIAGLFLAVRAFTGYRIATKDREFCFNIVKALKRSLITIKIASIDHDQPEIFQEISSLMRIEKAYKRILKTSIISYLFDRSAKGSKKQEEVIRKLPLPLKG